MKTILLLLCLFFSFDAIAQQDSTKISFRLVQDKDLLMANELNGIQMLTIICNDTTMKGKRFLLSYDEYKDGKFSYTDDLGLDCVDKKNTFVVGNDTMIYNINFCDQVAYSDVSKEYSIRLGGKLENDTFNMRIDYQSLNMMKVLDGDKNYILRELNHKDGGNPIAIGKRTPIFAYSPPYDHGSGWNNYCILNHEPPEIWSEKYNLEHFYVFYLEIK
ncbi:MAG: hypothetical protein M9949_03355 [Candidatus Kapabacteria bacterium]|nr:hypothetical protein [Candidatus Kapabacteria bacterium]